jgi:hypothetical protein
MIMEWLEMRWNCVALSLHSSVSGRIVRNWDEVQKLRLVDLNGSKLKRTPEVKADV